jgi:hypothetical protein
MKVSSLDGTPDHIHPGKRAHLVVVLELHVSKRGSTA